MKQFMTRLLSSKYGRVMLGFQIWKDLPIVKDKEKAIKINKF